jgi:presenilin-like A22 family membrane protease
MRSLRWIGLLALYVGAQLTGLALALPFRSEGLATTSNPTSLTAPLFIIAIIVIAPLFILLLARRRGGVVALRHLILLGISGSLYFTLDATLGLVVPGPFPIPPVAAGMVVDLALPAAAVVSVGLYLALLMEPQWYIVDLVGFLAGGALIAVLGISFAILPVLLLLSVLAVYDYIAVYRTRHMIRLADVVTDMKLPILMVMPDRAGYDYTRSLSLAEQREQPTEERAALFMGLGDVVIPGALVASAFAWLPATPLGGGITANLLVALGALLGSLVGYALLMQLVLRGRAQAGLPFLNGFAILGYFVSFLLVYHSFGFGLTGAL